MEFLHWKHPVHKQIHIDEHAQTDAPEVEQGGAGEITVLDDAKPARVAVSLAAHVAGAGLDPEVGSNASRLSSNRSFLSFLSVCKFHRLPRTPALPKLCRFFSSSFCVRLFPTKASLFTSS